jgi:ribosomal protein S18 acetylase RimI-like enzyme
MGLTYFKRYRMEIDLRLPLFEPPPLPPGYRVAPWKDSLLAAHAEAKYRSFCVEIDANVFPCLGEREGCHKLMREISRREGFIPASTWLLEWSSANDEVSACGTVQGVCDGGRYGAIQNLGIAPEHRGQGLGTILLYDALQGFQQANLPMAYLEVTAQNVRAVRLYHRLGFNCVKTVYKAADVAYA